MRKLIHTLTIGLPVGMVATGLAIIALTPEVVTEQVEYHSSHSSAIGLVMIGLLVFAIAAMAVWDTSGRREW